MTGPLPHPTEPEFTLLSHSSGFRAKLIPKLPFSCCFQGCALGLHAQGGGQTPSVLPCLAHHAGHVPLDHPWSRTGAGGGWLSGPRLHAQHLPGVQAGELLAPC